MTTKGVHTVRTPHISGRPAPSRSFESFALLQLAPSQPERSIQFFHPHIIYNFFFFLLIRSDARRKGKEIVRFLKHTQCTRVSDWAKFRWCIYIYIYIATPKWRTFILYMYMSFYYYWATWQTYGKPDCNDIRCCI